MNKGICLRCLRFVNPRVDKIDLAVGKLFFFSQITLHMCLEDNLIRGRQVFSQVHVSAKEFHTWSILKITKRSITAIYCYIYSHSIQCDMHINKLASSNTFLGVNGIPQMIIFIDLLGKNGLCCIDARWLIAICNGRHKISSQWLIWLGNITYYAFFMDDLDEEIKTMP